MSTLYMEQFLQENVPSRPLMIINDWALEPRIYTRWDMHKYARDAYELGVRYIGGCCGFEAYHIRSVCEELREERGGKIGKGSEKHDMWGGGLKMHTKPWVRARYIHYTYVYILTLDILFSSNHTNFNECCDLTKYILYTYNV